MSPKRMTTRAFGLGSEPQARARLAFLEATKMLMPELWSDLRAAMAAAADARAYRRELLLWARRYNLGRRWVLLAAHDVVRGRVPVDLLPLRPFTDSVIGRAEQPLESITYDPVRESRDEFLHRARAYAEAQERRFEGAKWVQDMNDPEVLQRNARWAVRWHLLGDTSSYIAEREVPPDHPDRLNELSRYQNRVSKAVHVLARELPLPRRRDMPGNRTG